MSQKLTFKNEEGETFTGEEVLGLTLEQDYQGLPEGSYLTVIRDEENNLYPFIKKDDETVELVMDEEVLDMVQMMLELVLADNESE